MSCLEGKSGITRRTSNMACFQYLQDKRLYRLFGLLALGQFASVLITFTGLTSSILARRGFNAPTSQSFFNYVLLTVVYGSTFIIRRKTLKVRWYYYLLLAILDVEGNFSVVKAYQYTSLTSVMLLDCWTIPCVLLLTWLFIKTKYNIGQLIGVCICILGLVLVILSDVHAKDRSGGSNVLLGDALVIIGATLYAFTNVSEEFLIKNVDFLELMTFLGLFSSIISGIQVAILERKELANTSWNRDVILSFSGFAASLFFFYSTVPFILRLSGSALLNLSLLSSDMWAVGIRTFAYHEKVDWLFYIAFSAVAVGLVVYNTRRTAQGPEIIASEETDHEMPNISTNEHEKSNEGSDLASISVNTAKDSEAELSASVSMSTSITVST
ncbi:hypothetical protein KP509_30G066800 [Ceratopteris richardii]|uniref:Solute carrier family 35 member F1 n=1 Tax=Ceratopteris richardii TaxID=49495 RepID=A0A8T2R3H2_CERRI|nr:hypothetical protein KP509_30G066800 [Ceratopteris richardii]